MSATSRRGVAASELDRIGSAKSRMAWSGGKERPKVNEDVDQFDANQNRASKGCWATFSGCVGGMWATRQMNRKDDREIYVRTTLRELIVYIIFLIILCVITFGMTSSTMFYYTKVLNELFMDTPFTDTRNTFRGSTQVMDYWRFLEMVLVENLYWEYWYDPQETATDAEDRNILYENRMIGVPRMRQLRVRSDSCSIPNDFQRVITKCYASYDSSFEDKEPFGVKNGTAWNYYSSDELGGRSYWGKLTTYSSAGSYIDLGTTKNETKSIIADLRENLWITRGTRAVFIDFTVYNANINLFCVIKLVIEFPATGGIIPSGSFNTVRLLRYVTTFDYFVLACECIFTFFIIYYIIEECLEIASIKWAYFKSVWNILDLLVIGLALVCIGFNIFKTFYVEEELPELLKYPNRFADFDLLGFLQAQFNNIVAVCVFFAWLKFFKYISFNKTMTQLSSTLSRCAKDVVGFAVMFFIVFFAFAQLGYLLFGTQVRDFSTFISASFNLLRTILGDFNFYEIQEANRILGPIFFLSYVFFVFFVLLNMFLAIINDTYSEVKAEIASQRNEFEIADYFRRGYNNLMGKFGRRDKLIDIEDALKLSDTNNDGMLSFEEVRTNLKKCNFSDVEIEMFFAKYDLDGNRMLEAHEVKQMLFDLEGKRNEIESYDKKMPAALPPSQRPLTARSQRPLTSRSIGREADPEEVEKLNMRLNHMEGSIGSIVNKIDSVLLRFDSMEKAKSKRKETMSKMLDDIIEDKDLDENERSRRIEKLVQDELKDWEKSNPQRTKTAMKAHIKDCI